MAQHIFELLRGYLAQYGYWTVAGALLLENAGLPVPGETVLLLASFLAFSEHRLSLPYVILVGVCAATFGDNLGYWIGRYGGIPLLGHYGRILHIRPHVINRGETLFRQYGALTVFIARFIAGVRIVAGPLAGVLRMPWKKFFIANFLGAVLWVTVISTVGYFFGSHWDELAAVIRRANVFLLVVAAAVAVFFWWREKRKRKTTSKPQSRQSSG
jgi:membrane protein DedA with SNARE-associated domain